MPHTSHAASPRHGIAKDRSLDGSQFRYQNQEVARLRLATRKHRIGLARISAAALTREAVEEFLRKTGRRGRTVATSIPNGPRWTFATSRNSLGPFRPATEPRWTSSRGAPSAWARQSSYDARTSTSNASRSGSSEPSTRSTATGARARSRARPAPLRTVPGRHQRGDTRGPPTAEQWLSVGAIPMSMSDMLAQTPWALHRPTAGQPRRPYFSALLSRRPLRAAPHSKSNGRAASRDTSFEAVSNASGTRVTIDVTRSTAASPPIPSC